MKPIFRLAGANKNKETISSARIANGVLFLAIIFIIAYRVYAATPNPGHPWTEVGDGTFQVTGPTSLRTYGFPNTDADVLTDYNLVQGDLLYADAASSTARLPKDTNATRYLSNTGTSNNPLWALVNLANGVTGILTSANGGTGNGFTKFTGPTTSERTFTLPDATATILTNNAAVTVGQGGTGLATLTSGAIVVGAGASSPTFLGGSVMATGTQILYDGTAWALSSSTSAQSYATGTLPVERWYTSPQTGTAMGAAVLGTANVLRAIPIIIPKKSVADRIAVNVTTLLSPSFVRIGIYANLASGSPYPGALVVDGGALSGATTGVKSATISSILNPGLYWLVYNTDSAATLAIRSFSVTNMVPMLGFDNTLGTAPGLAFTVASTCGTSCGTALPATYPTGGTVLTTAPAAVFVRFAQ